MHTAAVTDAVGVEADSWFDDILKNHTPMVLDGFANPLTGL
ncbi:hypothetical protein GCM10010195_65730 [Kitasatospora griseola]|nr:hypothetical protein GCM10010195_65730 [Kitasatospora griseola]